MMYPTISKKDRSCLNCKKFDFNPERPVKMNRECMYPAPVTVEDGVCQMWLDMRTLKQKLQGKTPMKRFC